MKKTIRNIIVWTGASAGILFLLYSCEKDVSVKLPDHTPSLVVHAYVAIGDSFVVAIGKSISGTIISTEEDTYVKDATAVLYEDNVIKDTLKYDELLFRYHSPVSAIPGKTYRLVVQAPGFQSVETSAYAPFPASTTIVSFQRDARVDMNGNDLSDVTFRINDPDNQKNYYLTELGSEFSSTFCVYTYDAAVEQYQGSLNPFESGNCIGNSEILIKDDLFNGSSRTITVSGDAWALQEVNLSNQTIRPYLKEYNISADFYEYVKDGINVDILEGNPFVEPHIVGGNVKNGYGLFTVYSVTVDTLR